MMLLVVMSMSWVFITVSGSQFNPILSMGMLIHGWLPWPNFIFNIIAQVLGTFGAL